MKEIHLGPLHPISGCNSNMVNCCGALFDNAATGYSLDLLPTPVKVSNTEAIFGKSSLLKILIKQQTLYRKN